MLRKNYFISVYNRKSGIVTNYSSIRHFLKDIFNRDFSLNWDNAFFVAFNEEVLQKFTSHNFRKVVVSTVKETSFNNPNYVNVGMFGDMVVRSRPHERLYLANLHLFKDFKKIALSVVYTMEYSEHDFGDFKLPLTHFKGEGDDSEDPIYK